MQKVREITKQLAATNAALRQAVEALQNNVDRDDERRSIRYAAEQCDMIKSDLNILTAYLADVFGKGQQ